MCAFNDKYVKTWIASPLFYCICNPNAFVYVHRFESSIAGNGTGRYQTRARYDIPDIVVDARAKSSIEDALKQMSDGHTVRLNRRRGPQTWKRPCDSRGLLSSCRPYQSYCTARLRVKHVFVCQRDGITRREMRDEARSLSYFYLRRRYKKEFIENNIRYDCFFSLSLSFFSSRRAGVRARHRCTNYVISLVRDSGNFST